MSRTYSASTAIRTSTVLTDVSTVPDPSIVDVNESTRPGFAFNSSNGQAGPGLVPVFSRKPGETPAPQVVTPLFRREMDASHVSTSSDDKAQPSSEMRHSISQEPRAEPTALVTTPLIKKGECV